MERDTLVQLGEFYLSDRVDRARELFQEALKVTREGGDREFKQNTFIQIGEVYLKRNKPTQAIEFFNQELVSSRAKGDRQGEAHSINQIGAAYFYLQKSPQALEFHQKALAIYKELNDLLGEANCLGYIGNLYFKTRQYRQTEALFRQKLDEFARLDNSKNKAIFLEVMRNYLEKQWHFQAAYGTTAALNLRKRLLQKEISWQEQLEIGQLNLFISQEIGDRQFEEHSLHSLGWVYRNLGQYSRALEAYQQSLAIAKERGVKEREAFLLIEIGLVYNDIA